ncbi:alpha/beta hydrolase family protein [Actinacidiphila acididurans]|uniref:Alpha/beta hydrolase n=1 Tax=Actinacidiphila acididurans TaxID=2784346 RepID=A0ABS2TR10_9ACTN|nr:alpha/beta hydrolase [Actinacidiphila acididurans]MBM9505759.1 alpha/beta hydrolase [Actinacidiphila acididurans]
MPTADARPSTPGPEAGPGLADSGDRAAAEEASAFSHAPVPPDATQAYGSHPDQIVDFYRPRPAAPDRPVPLVALIHGGAWRAAYDRTHISPLAAHLAAHGFAVASVEYRRGAPGTGQEPPATAAGPATIGAGASAPQQPAEAAGPPEPDLPAAGRWPDTFDDIATALDALPDLAVRALGADAVDPGRTVVTGHSAGGHLALWAAARHVLPLESPWHRASPPPYRGVVALAPIADFTSSIRLRVCSGAVLDLLGGTDRLEARLPYADPAALLPTGIATTIVHGTTDNEVPPQVSAAFARAAAAAGEEPTVAWLPATGHFPLIDPAAPACAAVADEIAQLAW